MPLRQLSKQVLQWIGKKTQIDTLFYANVLGWFGINYLSNILRGVCTTFLLARWLTPEIFGAFRYIIAVYGIAGIFGFSSYHAGIIRGVAAQDTEVAWMGAKKMIRYSFIGSLLLLGAGVERIWRGEAVIGCSLFVTALFFPFVSAGSLYGSILTGKGEVKRLSKYNTLSNLFFVGIFTCTLFTFKKNILAISIAFFGGDVLLKGIMSLYQLSKLTRQGSAAQHMQLGSHLSFMGIFQAFAFQIDQLLIQRFFGYTSLANYAIATLIPDQIVDFMKSFSGIFLQRKVTSPTTATIHSGSIVRRQMYTLLAMLAVVWAAYALSAPLFIPILFPQYTPQIVPSIVYALGIFGTITGLGLSWMQAQHALKPLWRFSLINSVLQTTSAVVLTAWLGGFGAILAKTFTRLASTPFAFPPKTKDAPLDRE